MAMVVATKAEGQTGNKGEEVKSAAQLQWPLFWKTHTRAGA